MKVIIAGGGIGGLTTATAASCVLSIITLIRSNEGTRPIDDHR